MSQKGILFNEILAITAVDVFCKDLGVSTMQFDKFCCITRLSGRCEEYLQCEWDSARDNVVPNNSLILHSSPTHWVSSSREVLLFIFLI